MPCELCRKAMSSKACPPPNRDLLQSGTSPSLMCCLEGFRKWRISSVSCNIACKLKLYCAKNPARIKLVIVLHFERCLSALAASLR